MGVPFRQIFKAVALGVAIIMISTLCLSSLNAQTEGTTGSSASNPADSVGGSTSGSTSGSAAGNNSGNYLYNIMKNTAGILQKVNDLPVMLKDITLMALSWVAPDDTDTTANLQQTFGLLGNLLTTEETSQLALQPKLSAQLLNNATPTSMPYANDLTFTTLLKMPYFAKDPRNVQGQPPVDPAYNYLANITGLGMPHAFPGAGGFSGNLADQIRYSNFFKTVTAIESFNAYVLSNLYVESQSPTGGFNTIQKNLITEASSSDWFSQVASENLGVVLRQLLMYQSQVFVLLSQSIKVQKQQLAAQILTNTMLMAVNLNNEQTLLAKASIRQPGS